MAPLVLIGSLSGCGGEGESYPRTDAGRNTGTDTGGDAGYDAGQVVNHPPSLSPIANQTVMQGQNLRLTVAASDPDGTTPILSSGPLPTGATFDPTTGVFQWTPNFNQSGSYPMVFRASDEAETVAQIVMITVTDVMVTAHPLTAAVQLNQYTISDQTRPRLAVSPSGNFIAAWDSGQDGEGWGIVGRFFGPGITPQGNEIQPQNNPAANQMDVAVAQNSSGLAAMVWSSGSNYNPPNTPDFAVVLQLFAPGGSPVSPNIKTTSWTMFNPDVAVNEAGYVAVVWANSEGPGWQIEGRIYDSSGTLLSNTFKINQTSAYYNAFPKVVAQPDGNFLVAWLSQNYTSLNAKDDYVRVRKYSSTGTPMGSEIDVIQGDLPYSAPRLGIDVTGKGIVAAGKGVIATTSAPIRKVSSHGVPLGEQIEFSSPSFKGVDAMAVAPSGNFAIISNSDYPATNGNLFVFDSDATLVDSAIPINFGNTYATDAQLIKGGLLHIVSVSPSLSPSNTEVYGQVFQVNALK